MSVQPLPNGGTLRLVAAAEVRAELARQRKPQQSLARALGISPQALSRRTNGELPFDVDELETAAAFLGVPVVQLLGAGRSGQSGQHTVTNVGRLRALPTPRNVTLRPHSSRPLLQVLSGVE